MTPYALEDRIGLPPGEYLFAPQNYCIPPVRGLVGTTELQDQYTIMNLSSLLPDGDYKVFPI